MADYGTNFGMTGAGQNATLLPPNVPQVDEDYATTSDLSINFTAVEAELVAFGMTVIYETPGTEQLPGDYVEQWILADPVPTTLTDGPLVLVGEKFVVKEVFVRNNAGADRTLTLHFAGVEKEYFIPNTPASGETTPRSVEDPMWKVIDAGQRLQYQASGSGLKMIVSVVKVVE